MPRYYCDYCDTYLTHDSPSVRKQHNAGYKHKANVRTYYQQFEEQQTQSLIDQRIKEHLGQAAAFQVGATFQQHLAALPGQRPRLPILPTPILPVPNAQLVPGMRPPVLPLPRPGAPGFAAAPIMHNVGMPPGSTPMHGSIPMPGSNPMHLPISSLPMPPTMSAPAAGGAAPPTLGGTPAMSNPAAYPTAAGPAVGGFNAPGGPPAAPSTAASQDGFTYPQTSETNH